MAGGFSIEDQTNIANNKKSGAKRQAKVLSKLCFFCSSCCSEMEKTYKRASSACVNVLLVWVKSKFCILRDKKQQVAGGFYIEDHTSIANNKKSGAKTQAKVLCKYMFYCSSCCSKMEKKHTSVQAMLV